MEEDESGVRPASRMQIFTMIGSTGNPDGEKQNVDECLRSWLLE